MGTITNSMVMKTGYTRGSTQWAIEMAISMVDFEFFDWHAVVILRFAKRNYRLKATSFFCKMGSGLAGESGAALHFMHLLAFDYVL